jgi:hypothetical protein
MAKITIQMGNPIEQPDKSTSNSRAAAITGLEGVVDEINYLMNEAAAFLKDADPNLDAKVLDWYHAIRGAVGLEKSKIGTTLKDTIKHLK